MLLSTNICKIPHKKGKNGKRRKGNKWPSVMEAYKFFFPDNEYIEKHRGADDAFYEADIVFKLYKMGIFKID
jgi:DNA polymerase-3 subunit epsilon